MSCVYSACVELGLRLCCVGHLTIHTRPGPYTHTHAACVHNETQAEARTKTICVPGVQSGGVCVCENVCVRERGSMCV